MPVNIYETQRARLEIVYGQGCSAGLKSATKPADAIFAYDTLVDFDKT